MTLYAFYGIKKTDATLAAYPAPLTHAATCVNDCRGVRPSTVVGRS